MLKRDFTKSNKEYFRQNKIALISLVIFLVVGIIVFAFFGMNGNFEIKGYSEFTVTITESKAEDKLVHQQEISKIVNSFDAEFDSISIYGEGDDTQYVVRYSNKVSNSVELEINKLVAEKLEVEIDNVSEHIKVGPAVKTTDYIYTAVAILIIVLFATILSYVRYNGASALSVLLACLIGTLGFMSFGAILRLVVGLSYFAMLVMLNVLIAYGAINLFETMHKSSWLTSREYDKAIQNSLKQSKTRMTVLSVGLMLIGVLLVLVASSAIKYVALNVMFMAVVLLAVVWCVVPFVWSVFITCCRQREYKIKATEIEQK